MPTDPTPSPGWIPNPGLEGSTLMDAEFINHKTFNRLTGSGVSIKGLVLEFPRISPLQSLALLEWLESHTKVALTVFGCLEKAQKAVPVLRSALISYRLAPPRPEGWVDIYKEEAALGTKIEQVWARATNESGAALNSALTSLSRHEKLKRALKNSIKNPPTAVDHFWSLMRVLAPVGKVSTRMTPKMIATIGTTTQPGTKRRAGFIDGAPAKQARSIRFDGVSASDPMALLRIEVEVDRSASDTDQPICHRQVTRESTFTAGRWSDTTSTGARHHKGIAEGPRASSYVHPRQGDKLRGSVSSHQPTAIFLVGGSHAIQSNMGLTGS